MNVPSLNSAFYVAASPILILAWGAIKAMLQSVVPSVRGPAYVAAVLWCFLGAALAASVFWVHTGSNFLGGALHIDMLAHWGQIFVLSLSLVITLLAWGTSVRSHFFRPEIASLFLMSVMGMLVMMATDDLISLFIGLELSSLAIYAMVGYLRPTRKSQEGAVKYFILGSIATAVLLFGFAMIYVSTGSLAIEQMLRAANAQSMQIWLGLGLLATICGFGFKLALVPFHLWSPDAYEGAPTVITAYMATCVKVMILTVLLRFLAHGFPVLHGPWLGALVMMSAASMLFGNTLALVQTNVKRMLAYSAIAHSGYLTLAVTAGGSGDLLPMQAIFFYMFSYGVASLLTFGILMSLEDAERDSLNLDDLRGLSKAHPALACGLAAAMFSFSGLPPLAGFMAKFFVFNAALQAGNLPLVLVAVIGSVISLYYYLRVIVLMFMQPALSNAKPLVASRSYMVKGLLALSCTLLLLLGTVLPGPVLERFAFSDKVMVVEPESSQAE